MLRPVRTVRATTKEELDAALATADQVTVEGDDELLSYAINKAADDPGNRVSIEGSPGWLALSGGRAFISYRRDVDQAGKAEELAEPNTPAFLRRGRKFKRSSWLLIAAAALVGLLGIGAASWAWFIAEAPVWGAKAPIDSHPPVEFHPLPAPSQPSQPSTSNGDFWSNLPSLIWPLVAIVAIIALFLIARQAISSGSNVTITWKVTEKVSGKVVITKVRESAPRSAKVA